MTLYARLDIDITLRKMTEAVFGASEGALEPMMRSHTLECACIPLSLFFPSTHTLSPTAVWFQIRDHTTHHP